LLNSTYTSGHMIMTWQNQVNAITDNLFLQLICPYWNVTSHTVWLQVFY